MCVAGPAPLLREYVSPPVQRSDIAVPVVEASGMQLDRGWAGTLRRRERGKYFVAVSTRANGQVKPCAAGLDRECRLLVGRPDHWPQGRGQRQTKPLALVDALPAGVELNRDALRLCQRHPLGS